MKTTKTVTGLISIVIAIIFAITGFLLFGSTPTETANASFGGFSNCLNGAHLLYEVYEEPTCTESGRSYYKCANCPYTENIQTLRALGHDFTVLIESVGATCTTDGHRTLKCSRCDETYTEYYEAFGHDFQDNYCTHCGACSHFYFTSEMVYATCTESGINYTRCSICGEILDSYVIPALGHDYNEDGYCTRCGDHYGCDHRAGRTETTAATCTKEGLKTVYCEICGEVMYTERIPVLGHDYDEDGYCTRCGEFDTGPCEHVPGRTEVIPATCTENGYEYVHCEICDQIILTGDIPALGHNYVNVDGSQTEYVCTRCEDINYETPSTEEPDEYGHIYEIVYEQPMDCTHDHIVIYACKIQWCASTYTITEQAPGHQWGNGAVLRDGNFIYTCTVCGYEYTVEAGAYRVEYQPGEHCSEGKAQTLGYNNGNISLSEYFPTWTIEDGYKFIGWEYSGDVYAAGTTVNVSEAITVIAVYAPLNPEEIPNEPTSPTDGENRGGSVEEFFKTVKETIVNGFVQNWKIITIVLSSIGGASLLALIITLIVKGKKK